MRWFVVLRADGVVETVEGAPEQWVGQRLTDAPNIPEAVQRAAVDLVLAAPTSIVRRRHVTLDETGETEVDLLLVEALPVRRERTSVPDLVMRTLDLFMSQARANEIELSADLKEGVPTHIVADCEKLAWAVSTLVANALRYAKKQVRLEARLDEPKNELVIDVRDDGDGIPEARARWLFERNPATSKSAGLALLMVNDVMIAHRGSVAVKSSPGQGSTFTMRVPRLG